MAEEEKTDAASSTWEYQTGSWRLHFSWNTQELHCVHLPSQQRLEGTLTFEADTGKGIETWTVLPARDGFEERLAVRDKQGNVQAFLNCYAQSDQLILHPIHRPPHNFWARLRYTGACERPAGSFACRTRPDKMGRVVQMASGAADSTLNESIFTPDSDQVIRFTAGHVALQTLAAAPRPRFKFSCDAYLLDSARQRIEIAIEDHYYQERYVPNYAPRDRQRCPKAPTGWMSWNSYFDTAGEEENLAEARIGKQYLQPFGMDIWHIESWQDNSDRLPVSGFSNLNLKPNPRQFPHGMAWLAQEIKKLDFKPGIWTVPFGTGNRDFYEEHKPWFLHNPDGSPMKNWCGQFLLDPSQEAVRDYMRESHRIMSQDWGYEYFKIDGMSGRHHSYSAHFFERDEVRAAFRDPGCPTPFRQCLQALREGIGPDRLWLACQGHYTGPEIGLCDAGRLGSDIVSANKPPDWHNYSDQARISLNQLFVNNIVWYNDPDTLMVGAANPLEVVRLAAAVVALPGQMMFSGDKLGELPPERMRLLQQCLPVLDIQPRDLFPIYDMIPAWDLKVQRDFASWDVVSLFNWAEDQQEVAVTFEELGLPAERAWLVYDVWNQVLSGDEQGFEATLAPHSNALFTVHPSTDHPWFIGTDRHITQGGVSLRDLKWDAGALSLDGCCALVGGFPSVLSFHVPESFHLDHITADEAVQAHVISEDRIFRVQLSSESSGDFHWRLHFRQ